ncbi:hypothetical protein VTO58DRAFT_102490 [Aureobasidium pullulans]
MTSGNAMKSSNCSLYNNESLSDITISFSGQQVIAHKAILAHKSTYFLRAFTSLFGVAASTEINLGDDDDAEAVHAMIRHIYDLPYAVTTNKDGQDGNVAYAPEECLKFQLNVFMVADKYHVSCLCKQVVPEFLSLLQVTWTTEVFAECVQKLCGPEAIVMADSSLQAAVATFFANNMSKITHHESLVKMIQQDQTFTGRVLAGILTSTLDSTRHLVVCYKPDGSVRRGPDCTGKRKGDPGYLAALNLRCVHCGNPSGQTYHKSGGQAAASRLANSVKVILM